MGGMGARLWGPAALVIASAVLVVHMPPCQAQVSLSLKDWTGFAHQTREGTLKLAWSVIETNNYIGTGPSKEMSQEGKLFFRFPATLAPLNASYLQDL